jgi:hypothetical protein
MSPEATLIGVAARNIREMKSAKRTKKPPKRTAIQKRQAMAAEARKKFPILLEYVNEPREKAKERSAIPCVCRWS